MIRKFCIPLVLIIGLSYQLISQTTIHGENDIWLFNLLNYKIDNKWSLGNELHFRMDDYFKDRQQILVRPFVNYQNTSKIVFTGGYTFILTSPYGNFPLPIDKPEHNIWMQMFVKHQVGNWEMAHRYRLENRWSGKIVEQHGQSEINGFQFGTRFRYRFILRRDINRNLYVHIFDELWINESDAFKQINFDRNWIYFGLGWKFNKHFAIETAYLHQYIRNNDMRYERHPTLQLSTIINL